MDLYLVLILVLAKLGVLNTLYLSYHTITKSPVTCYLFPDEWCRRVQYSKQSRTFGIPNSFAGLAFYSIIVILTWLFWVGSVPFWPIQVIVGVGIAFAAYFTLVQAFILRAFCTWCVFSAIDFAMLGYAVFILR